jgi:hypothetical protein
MRDFLCDWTRSPSDSIDSVQASEDPVVLQWRKAVLRAHAPDESVISPWIDGKPVPRPVRQKQEEIDLNAVQDQDQGRHCICV